MRGPLFPVWPFDLTPWPLLSFEGHSTLLFYYTRLRKYTWSILLRFFYCLVYLDLLKIYFIRARSRVILETWGVLYKLLHCSILLLFGALEVYIDRILLTRYLHRFYFLCFHVVHKCSTRAPPFGNKPYSHTDVWRSRCVWIWVCVNLRANVYCELNTIPLTVRFFSLQRLGYIEHTPYIYLTGFEHIVWSKDTCTAFSSYTIHSGFIYLGDSTLCCDYSERK